MRIKLLKNIVGHVAGKSAVNIVDLLADKKNVNEFLIAKKLVLTINQTRNILYKLAEEHLVSFTRKKDKRKGWYTYFWTLNTDKTLEFLKKMISLEINQIESQLNSRATKRFYICRNCNIEMTEENALLNNFTCQECGNVYELNTDESVVKELKSRVNALKRDMEFVETELMRESEVKGKRIKRQMKKEAKDKAKEREARKKAREKEKKKLLKISNKGKKVNIKKLIKKVRKAIKGKKKKR